MFSYQAASIDGGPTFLLALLMSGLIFVLSLTFPSSTRRSSCTLTSRDCTLDCSLFPFSRALEATRFYDLPMQMSDNKKIGSMRIHVVNKTINTYLLPLPSSTTHHSRRHHPVRGQVQFVQLQVKFALLLFQSFPAALAAFQLQTWITSVFSSFSTRNFLRSLFLATSYKLLDLFVTQTDDLHSELPLHISTSNTFRGV